MELINPGLLLLREYDSYDLVECKHSSVGNVRVKLWDLNSSSTI